MIRAAAQHTRFRCKRCEGVGRVVDVDLDGRDLDEERCGDCDGTGVDGRARLNASAPELLEALRSMIYLRGASADLDRDIVTRAKAAIARAEGVAS